MEAKMVWSQLKERLDFSKKLGMINRKLLSNTFIVLALIGLVWQLSLICQLHFAYKVTTSTTIFFPKTIRPEPLHFCVAVSDFIGKPKAPRIKSNSSSRMKSLTAKELFDATPSTEGLIYKIVVRNKSSYTPYSINNPGIDVVKVEKIFYMRYMCYQFTFKQDQVLDVQEAVTTAGSSGMIRTIRFSNKFRAVSVVKFILGHLVHGFETTPYFLRLYNKTLGRGIYNYFISHHYSMRIKSMKYPYETDCLNYEEHGIMDEHQCIEYCVGNKTYEKIGKLPFTIQIHSNSNLSVLYRISDKQTFRFFREIESVCSETYCSKPACHDYQVITVTSPFVGFRTFRWKHVVPAQTSVKINSRPSLTFVEFLTYVLGTISTWTGLSVFAMNPFTLVFGSWINLMKSKSRFNHKIHDTNVHDTSIRQCQSKCREELPRCSL